MALINKRLQQVAIGGSSDGGGVKSLESGGLSLLRLPFLTLCKLCPSGSLAGRICLERNCHNNRSCVEFCRQVSCCSINKIFSEQCLDVNQRK